MVFETPAAYEVYYGKNQGEQIIDGYCPSCHRETTYHLTSATPNRVEWDYINKRHAYDTINLYCVRNRSHSIKFNLYIKNGILQKIGQFPSLADIANDQNRIFKGLLNKVDASELHKAIGLASHGVGIGSFVYLRRVFERLVKHRFDEFKEQESWNDDKFNRLRMHEKIDLLKDHLPQFMVQKKKVYSILSSGIHSLTEEKCLSAFGFIKQSIIIILEEDRRNKEELSLRKDLESAIAAFSGNENDLELEIDPPIGEDE